MKRVNNIYNSITDIDVIMDMYNIMKSNIKNKRKVLKFEEFYTYNIINIKNILVNREYKVIKYNIFIIKEPKYRIVMSQNVHDKLINHLVAKYFLVDILDKSLINTNIATRLEKGTHYGIKLLKQYLVKLLNKNETIYALKFDIHKYFYNIDHEILIQKLEKEIKDIDVINILKTILNSTNNEYVNKIINSIKEIEKNRIENLNISIKEKNLKRKEIDSIPLYLYNKGLPIGNMTSQILAIFYLNDLDHYIKEKLKCKYYIRYMDDGLILSSDKDYLVNCLNEISLIVRKHHLNLNKKTAIINVNKNGVDFLGFKFYIKNKKIFLKVRNDTKKRFKKKVQLKDKEIINSYKSHFKYGNCYNLFQKYTKG